MTGAGARRVAVVGGGITGLTAARRLMAAGHHATVFESCAGFGGKIRATPFGGLPALASGPDALLARVPWGTALLDELGFDADELVAPATGTAFVAHGGKLHTIPDGLVLGVPAGMSGLVRSPLLSWAGKARAGLDLVLPKRSIEHDSLGRLIRDRFGAEVLERLVDPLVGSINAGDADQLSLAASTPQIAAVASARRSLLLGLRRSRSTTPVTGPVFVSPRAGLTAIIDRLVAALGEAGAGLRAGAAVGEITRDGHGYRVDDEPFDGIVMTAPGNAASGLLRTVAPDTAARLASIAYAGVVMVTLRIDDRRVLSAVPRGSGLLVPKPDQLHLTAVSFASRKWAEWQPPDGGEIFRISLGRYGNQAPLDLDDATCVSIATKEFAGHLGLAEAVIPAESRVTRWADSFPQYEPHHLDRIAQIERAVAGEAPNLVLAGAAYRGVGIPACIRQAGEAVTLLCAPWS